MEIDHLLSALRLYERRTPADPPPAANRRAFPGWRMAQATYRRAKAAGRAHSHSPLIFLGPGPETRRTTERWMEMGKKRWKCFTGLQQKVVVRAQRNAQRKRANLEDINIWREEFSILLSQVKRVSVSKVITIILKNLIRHLKLPSW